jgi:hypothetical protein
MSLNQQDLNEKFNNYKKSLNEIKNNLIVRIKEIRNKNDIQKTAKILEDINSKF